MATGDRTIIFYLTDNGSKLAKRLSRFLKGAEALRFRPEKLARIWERTEKIIFIMATGIVVRAVAPFVRDKATDPGVVVLDEKGTFAISLLSGHIGGANRLARQIADCLGSQAVITTASDVHGKLSLDTWAMDKGLYIQDMEKLKEMSARIVNGGWIKIMVEQPLSYANLPQELIPVDFAEGADIIISNRSVNANALFLRPQNLIIGIGCNRGTDRDEIEKAISKLLLREALSYHSIRSLATIAIKRQENGLLEFVRANGLSIDFFTDDELYNVALAHNIKGSKVVKDATGTIAVAEPASILGAKKLLMDLRESPDNYTVLIHKEKWGNITLAITMVGFTL